MLNEAQDLHSKLVSYRRQIHSNPELGFQEFKTAQLVVDALQEIGVDQIRTQVGRTGVTAQIGPASGPQMGIRADMDALPIQEELDHSFASQNPNVMHACGHDAHTAMLLGAAELLHNHYRAHQGEWEKGVRLLFQPSEEGMDSDGISGATAMIQDNALEALDRVIALHVDSTSPAGQAEFCDGYALAAADSFEAWIRGDGGHGATPYKGVDPLYILSAVLPLLYGIPSRRIDPTAKCIVSLGQISAGAASNVIPAEVYIQGTIRSLDEEVRQTLWHEIEQSLKVSETLGGSYEFRLHKGYPAMINSAEVNDWMRSVTADLMGAQAVVESESPLGMGAEDFSYMTQAMPGAMFMLGAAAESVGAHHTPRFDIDESVLPMGSAILAETAVRYVTGQVS